MREQLNTNTAVTVDDLQVGDILLRKLPALENEQYWQLSIDFIAELKANDWDLGKVQLPDFLPLLQYVTAVLDGGEAYSPAYVGATKNWLELPDDNGNGELKHQLCMVHEHPSRGIEIGAVEDLVGEQLIVLRYQGLKSGTESQRTGLSQAFEDNARAVFKELKGSLFTINNTALILALSIVRIRKKDLASSEKHVFLERVKSNWGKRLVEDVFDQKNQEITSWLDYFARLVLTKCWDEKAMLSSQFVGEVYKRSIPSFLDNLLVNNKKISSKENVSTVRGYLEKDMQTVDGPKCPILLLEFKEALLSLPKAPAFNDLRSFDSVLSVLGADDMLTPGDLIRSPDLEIIGRLKRDK